MSLTAAILAFLLILSPLTLTITATEDVQTAYEVLAGYNFPIGILPKGVTGYELDRRSGKFRAYLNGSCSFSIHGSYQLKYKSTISGYISDKKLTMLSGVSVKVVFLWLNIVDVTRNENQIEFSVGIASASFSLDDFYVSPQCGCGLDCSDVKTSKLRRSNPFISSI